MYHWGCHSLPAVGSAGGPSSVLRRIYLQFWGIFIFRFVDLGWLGGGGRVLDSAVDEGLAPGGGGLHLVEGEDVEAVDAQWGELAAEGFE